MSGGLYLQQWTLPLPKEGSLESSLPAPEKMGSHASGQPLTKDQVQEWKQPSWDSAEVWHMPSPGLPCRFEPKSPPLPTSQGFPWWYASASPDFASRPLLCFSTSFSMGTSSDQSLSHDSSEERKLRQRPCSASWGPHLHLAPAATADWPQLGTGGLSAVWPAHWRSCHPGCSMQIRSLRKSDLESSRE